MMSTQTEQLAHAQRLVAELQHIVDGLVRASNPTQVALDTLAIYSHGAPVRIDRLVAFVDGDRELYATLVAGGCSRPKSVMALASWLTHRMRQGYSISHTRPDSGTRGTWQISASPDAA